MALDQFPKEEEIFEYSISDEYLIDRVFNQKDYWYVANSVWDNKIYPTIFVRARTVSGPSHHYERYPITEYPYWRLTRPLLVAEELAKISWKDIKKVIYNKENHFLPKMEGTYDIGTSNISAVRTFWSNDIFEGQPLTIDDMNRVWKKHILNNG